MGWRRRWPEQTRTRRPAVRKLTESEKTQIVETLNKGIAKSPVLTALGIQVRVARGRFYLERQSQEEGSETNTSVWARITPLDGTKPELLLEVGDRRASWSEIARGQAAKLIKIVASDSRGTFHGLGRLDASLRQLKKGQDRLPMKMDRNRGFKYEDAAEKASVQEALFHFFGLPIDVIAEPSAWYSYQRTPMIVEVSDDQTRVLVRFIATSLSGESFGGTCLYIHKDDGWAACTVKPSESETIATAVAWLVKRKWRAW
ncbi:hypothetical protein Poly51_38300 [Rubripirellula tenax]|uniref:Uncharacterized protein n=1 Tax=Rubripirellula tenax TaxID=2528015 RepID=A0A5C6ENT1_9BACT|nr:hypothetical protein [Rubripirellula tenax]TWU50538.1 hypothetical protein Poly51_38300 [Rubripirellula tenax]